VDGAGEPEPIYPGIIDRLRGTEDEDFDRARSSAELKERKDLIPGDEVLVDAEGHVLYGHERLLHGPSQWAGERPDRHGSVEGHQLLRSEEGREGEKAEEGRQEKGKAHAQGAGASMSIERAFCRNIEHTAAFRAYGLPDKLTWVDGRGAEDLERCIASFRGRPGRLLVAPDLRVFGASRQAVSATMAKLEKAKIRVVDVIHPQDETIAQMLQRAANLIGRPRFRDRRTAISRGRQGGLAKGEKARSDRAQIDTDTLIRNLVAERKTVGWDMVVRICGGLLSESTLRRYYLIRMNKRKKARRRK
jgi:hypothetical protein